MSGNLSFSDLQKSVANGEIDTVLACQIDMQGRLMGKRFHAQYFIDKGFKETHSCNYLQATDLEMETISGYKSCSWEEGYGDFTMKPDLDTIRRLPWLEATALVLCDLEDHKTHQPVEHSPRAVLKKQIARLEAMGMKPMMASELEFYLFDQSFEEAEAQGYRNLTTFSKYNEDYNIFQTTKEEHVMRAIRNGLYGAGITVECSKGEACAGQEEINVEYSDALNMADQHVITKNACREIAWQQGNALTFLAKWKKTHAGSSSHVHQSLWSLDGKEALFADPNGKYGMSELMQHYMAGLLKHAGEITYFLAPYINSYKRFQEGTFAPTQAVWSLDNRTAGYRVCGDGGKSVRVECRVGGSDLNPYLAAAALIAAGIDGIENKLTLEDEYQGDAYTGDKTRVVPATLRGAAETLTNSKMLRAAMGDDVIDHYYRAATWEVEEYDRVVTDYEVARGFERA